jgi:hypothetical protein
MTEPVFYIVMATAALAGLAMIVGAALAGWRGWLELKGRQLAHAAAGAVAAPEAGAVPAAAARIEIADLKERIRKLEAIAAGVEL